MKILRAFQGIRSSTQVAPTPCPTRAHISLQIRQSLTTRNLVLKTSTQTVPKAKTKKTIILVQCNRKEDREALRGSGTTKMRLLTYIRTCFMPLPSEIRFLNTSSMTKRGTLVLMHSFISRLLHCFRIMCNAFAALALPDSASFQDPCRWRCVQRIDRDHHLNFLCP